MARTIPPAQPHPRPDKDKRLNAIISFSTHLQAQLTAACTDRKGGPLFLELQKHIAEFPTPRSLASHAAPKCEEIDSIGAALWNLCTRLRRNYDDDEDEEENAKEKEKPPIILLFARIYAFLLLDFALEVGKGGTVNVIRVMRIGIKATRQCLEAKIAGDGKDKQHAEYTLRVLEKVGGYEVLLKTPDGEAMKEDNEVYRRLVAEYYVLRTSAAWQDGQWEVAEHMFKKSMAAKDFFDPSTIESLADVLFEIGKQLLAKRDYPMAAKWLERSYDILGPNPDKLSIDATELRLSIVASWTKSLLGLDTPESTEKARNTIELMENDFGNKLLILLLRLDILASSTNDVFDSASYHDIISRIIRSMQLTKSNVTMVMHHIQKLRDKSPSLACKALDEFIQSRLVTPESTDEWVERALMTRIWIAVGLPDSSDSIVSLEVILSVVADNREKQLTTGFTQGAHTLLWKRIESSYTQTHYQETEGWCRLSLHKLFQNAGEYNLARLSRKLLLCSLAKQDFNTARDIFGSMSPIAQDEPMTRFLMYKIAIRSNETKLVAECLHILSLSPEPEFLYACVKDAQQLGQKSQTLLALQMVFEKLDYGATPNTINLPSLLRITIQLSVAVLEESVTNGHHSELEAISEKLCKLFEGAVTSMSKEQPHKGDTMWPIKELDWFSKNSYNLATSHLSSWNPRHLLRILTCCIAYIGKYPADISADISQDLSLRKMFCDFLAAIALVALARGEDKIETQLQDYLKLRKHVNSYDQVLQEKSDACDEEILQDLLAKLAILQGFDFEAACRLKAWDSLSEIINKAATCNDSRVYEIMADCLIPSEAPINVLIASLKRIINQSWELDNLDCAKLAKYMRCAFQLALSYKSEIAEELLLQTHAFMKESQLHDNDPYPSDELEWIAARAFNHGVDLHLCGDDPKRDAWCQTAIEMAHCVVDGQGLVELFEEKYAKMKLEGKGKR